MTRLAGRADDEALLEEPLLDGRGLAVELDAADEARAADVDDGRVALLQRGELPRRTTRPSRRPSRRALRSTSSSRTARPSRQATGLPPKVVPWWPGFTSPSIRGPVEDRAEREAAAERLGERARRRGRRPSAWKAKRWPVRPRPHWISSKTRTAPVASASSRAVRRNSVESGTIPPSPWIGSRKIADVVPSTAAFSASTSFGATNVDAREERLERLAVGRVAREETAPTVRPWNESVEGDELRPARVSRAART